MAGLRSEREPWSCWYCGMERWLAPNQFGRAYKCSCGAIVTTPEREKTPVPVTERRASLWETKRANALKRQAARDAERAARRAAREQFWELRALDRAARADLLRLARAARPRPNMPGRARVAHASSIKGALA